MPRMTAKLGSQRAIPGRTRPDCGVRSAACRAGRRLAVALAMLVVPAMPSAEAVQAEQLTAEYLDYSQHMLGRPLTASEVQALREEVARGLAESPEETMAGLPALQNANATMEAARTAGERAWWRNAQRMEWVFGFTAQEQAESTLMAIVNADDPALTVDPSSETLITRRDAEAALALERLRTEGVAAGVPDALVTQVAPAFVERFHQAPAAERRVYALLDAWWTTLEQSWPSLSAEQRAQVRAALGGEAPLSPELTQSLVGQDSMVAFFQDPSAYSTAGGEYAGWTEEEIEALRSVIETTGIMDGLATVPSPF